MTREEIEVDVAAEELDAIIDPVKPAKELSEEETIKMEKDFMDKQLKNIPWIPTKISDFHLSDAITPKDINNYIAPGDKLDLVQFMTKSGRSHCRRIKINFLGIFKTDNPEVYQLFFTFDNVVNFFDNSQKIQYCQILNSKGYLIERAASNVINRTYVSLYED